MEVFGPHLIIDGSRCNTQKLADRILVEQVLNDYPAAIGMTKIGGPYMFEYQAPDPAYSGVSGLVVIAESHIAIHTFPELDYFTMDIFSCKNFDHEKAISYIKDAFDVQEMDRMLVQRGLSFKGPHHGRDGATDELIAAAEARLAAGVVSKEPAIPDDVPASGLDDSRGAALERLSTRSRDGAGRMVWPQYGVTPDIGTYGAETARGGAQVVALSQSGQLPQGTEGESLSASEPVQVNPTASISGLLDKMVTTSGQGRKLGLALAEWECLVRQPETLIALTLSSQVVAAGMRELLVYVVEHRYVDVVIASADELFADLYESLGYPHHVRGDAVVALEPGREHAQRVFADVVSSLSADVVQSGSDLWLQLGQALPSIAPRKGLLQAAAKAGIRIYTPDLSTSAFGGALLAARSRGTQLTLDPSDDLLALSRTLSTFERVGVISTGSGVAGQFITQARDILPALGLSVPAIDGYVSLGGTESQVTGAHAIVLPVDASLALPLLVTGLAQRYPRVRAARSTAAIASAPAETALA